MLYLYCQTKTIQAKVLTRTDVERLPVSEVLGSSFVVYYIAYYDVLQYVMSNSMENWYYEK